MMRYLHSIMTRVSPEKKRSNDQQEGRDAQAYEDHSLQPIRFSILHDVVDSQHREEEDDRLERVEEHRERTTHDPSKGDDEWDDEQRNLLEGGV